VVLSGFYADTPNFAATACSRCIESKLDGASCFPSKHATDMGLVRWGCTEKEYLHSYATLATNSLEIERVGFFKVISNGQIEGNGDHKSTLIDER
jgi:hypothetical protein